MDNERTRKRVRFEEEVVVVQGNGTPIEGGQERVGNFGNRSDLLRSLKEDEEKYADDLDSIQKRYDNISFQEYSKDMGYQIEPFNFLRERQEGFFDEEGNYVEYRLREAQDPWLTSLEEEEVIDLEAIQQLRLNDKEDLEVPEMSGEQVLKYKQELAQILQAGETVLDALRRLGRRPRRQRKGKKRLIEDIHPKYRESVPVENREDFDKVTELADILLHNGHFQIYSVSKEELQPNTQLSIEDTDSICRVNNIAISDTDNVNSQITEQDIDMFDDDYKDEKTSLTQNEETQVDEYDEFILDQDTGWFYNSQYGCYYDPVNQLYGDASTGVWYKYEDGEYRINEVV